MMTLAEALPMLRNGKSLSEVERIAEKRKAEAKPPNVVSLAEARAKMAAKAGRRAPSVTVPPC